jgi:hypothetical protein
MVNNTEMGHLEGVAEKETLNANGVFIALQSEQTGTPFTLGASRVSL